MPDSRLLCPGLFRLFSFHPAPKPVAPAPTEAGGPAAASFLPSVSLGTPSPALSPRGLPGHRRTFARARFVPVMLMQWARAVPGELDGILVISLVWESQQVEAWYWPIIFSGQLWNEMTSRPRWGGWRREERGQARKGTRCLGGCQLGGSQCSAPIRPGDSALGSLGAGVMGEMPLPPPSLPSHIF